MAFCGLECLIFKFFTIHGVPKYLTIHLLFCQECGRELLDEPELGLLEGPAHVVELAKVGDVEDQGVKLSIVNSRVVRKFQGCSVKSRRYFS